MPEQDKPCRPPRTMLVGNYAPPDYFDEPVSFEDPSYSVRIYEGRIEVVFPDGLRDPDVAVVGAAKASVTRVFQTRMVLILRRAEKPDLTLEHHLPDGKRTVHASARTRLSVVTFGLPDLTVEDDSGEVSRSSREERIADEREFRDLTLRHQGNPLLGGLLESFERALRDPANRMTHLYEIRDALKTHFGGDSNARIALGITHNDWSEFGRIANALPIKESRHRGLHDTTIEATEEQNFLAFSIARSMIKAYVHYLE